MARNDAQYMGTGQSNDGWDMIRKSKGLIQNSFALFPPDMAVP